MKRKFAEMAGLAILVSACGPDGEPDETPNWGEFDAAQEAEAPKLQPALAPSSDVADLLNVRRAENGLPPLSPSAKLSVAAQVHVQDMAKNGFFSHTGSDNSSVGDRVRAQGYNFCFVAENIAQGQKTAAETMQSWMDSPGHRQNNLSPKATEYGAARGAGDYWVLVFGRSGC